MSTESPIWMNAEGDYDFSITCEKGGALPNPWKVVVKITPAGSPTETSAEWRDPRGYESYEAGKAAGIEKAKALVLDLERKQP